ncbi:MAG: tRNA pseudouridine(38-40) synthase TruA [Fimbriimonas sp.]|nr:tRNA pseudouridine(38-40) synthase TruA [Fimbriimonas sp.]
MKRIQLVVSYDGTDFRGWAAQTGQRTVQSTLREAVRRISGEEIEIVGASRTDSGAHAKGQVCHFDTEVPIEPEKWARILNRVLEPDVAVVTSKQVDASFHSRFCAKDRMYRYRISTSVRDPIRSRFAHHYGRPLDVRLMNQAARALVGDHDFVAFTEELDPSVENTRRTLFSIDVRQVRDEVWVDVVGTAFLRGMMRRIAGALLEVGRGYRPVEEVSRLLGEERNRLMWPVVLPANGLCLMRIRYGRNPKDNRSGDNRSTAS